MNMSITHKIRNIFNLHAQLIQINKFRNIPTILINGSSDSNHSTIFSVLVLVAFAKQKEKTKTRQQPTQTHNFLRIL